MATPISKTWLEMKLLSGGGTCQEAQELFLANFPGGTDSTAVDALTWDNIMRSAGHHNFLFPSIIRGMSAAQRKTLVIWLLQRLQERLPVGWVHTAAISVKIDEVIDCLNAPTAGKRAVLQAFASSLVIDWTDQKDRRIKHQLMRICNLVANQISDWNDVWFTLKDLMATVIHVTGEDLLTVQNAVLNKMEQIIGIRD